MGLNPSHKNSFSFAQSIVELGKERFTDNSITRAENFSVMNDFS